ncbi:hypothetical protein [Paenibacillus sp. NEAU-GSW1]|uniref:hypothetical protein n=1 Tax=Paenibacillus sp. NEAU-GSW1 TaxID=2682486 RepID=UPI0012E17914|nr:hypothetical protein [Paenibacillus sp. NEAU-GSW1]MUT64600.1 hypothetical protein [Paenibacillus sp. NEAU-GSW1]
MFQPAWYSKAMRLVGQPVGVSLTNGQGVTGVLCSVSGGTVVLQEYCPFTYWRREITLSRR